MNGTLTHIRHHTSKLAGFECRYLPHIDAKAQVKAGGKSGGTKKRDHCKRVTRCNRTTKGS